MMWITTKLSTKSNTIPQSIKIGTLNTCHKRDTRRGQNTSLRCIRTSTSSMYLKKDMKREQSIKLLRDKWCIMRINMLPKHYPFSILLHIIRGCFNNPSPIPKDSNNHIKDREDSLLYHILVVFHEDTIKLSHTMAFFHKDSHCSRNPTNKKM